MPPDPKPYRNIGPQPGPAPQAEVNPYAQFVTPPPATVANPYAQFVTPSAEDPSLGRTTARLATLAVQGVNEGFLPTLLGGTYDAAASLFKPSAAQIAKIEKATGRPYEANEPGSGREAVNRAVDYTSTLPGRVKDMLRQGSMAPLTESRTSRIAPETNWEKFAHGAGEGAGNAAAMILPAGVVARGAALPGGVTIPGARAGSTTQAIAEALASQPVAQAGYSAFGGGVGEATDSPILGMAAALGARPTLGLLARGVTPMPPARTAAEVERRALVDAALARNIPLTSGQISGNKGVQTLESVLENLPLSGGMQRGMIDQQRQAFNREVSGATGAPADAFTRAAREQRRADLGQEFERLSRGTTVNLDNQFVTQMGDLLNRYRQQLPPDVMQNVEQRISALLNAGTTPGSQQIPGEIYQRIRSSLSSQAASTGNNETRQALREARLALDAAARRSLPPDVATEWDTVRRQWGNLKTIESGMQNADAAVGNIAPRALGAAVDAANRRGGARSLTEISDIGRKILAPQIADSGTAQRTWWQNIATGGVPGAALAGGGFALGGVPGAVAAIATPPVVQKVLEYAGRSGYAGNRLLGNVETLPSREMVAKIGLAQALLAAQNKGAQP